MKWSAIPGGHSAFDVSSGRNSALAASRTRVRSRGSGWRGNARACRLVGAARNAKKQEKDQMQIARESVGELEAVRPVSVNPLWAQL